MQRHIQSPFFQTGNPETEDNTTLYAPGMLGCTTEFDQGGRAGPVNLCVYQLVKCASGVTPAVGSLLYWSDRSAVEVTTTATATGALAGVSRIVPGGAARYIWILKKGSREVLLIDSPTSTPDTAGKPVVGVTATAGKGDVLALATAPQPVLVGRCIGAQDGTSKRALCLVNIPDTL